MLDAYIVVDLEMTGLKVKTDRILEIGAVKVIEHQVVDTYEALVNPKMKIPNDVVQLTGITNEMAKKGCNLEDAVLKLFTFCEDMTLVGHNILFDYTFLKQYAVNHHITLEKKAVDTLWLARKFLPEAEKKTLDYLCEYLHIPRNQRHRALDDARAEGVLLEILQKRFADQYPEEFEPRPLQYKVKRQGSITPRQKKQLKELEEYHKIELPMELGSLSKNEASRLANQIMGKYGRMLSGTSKHYHGG
ncbi:MAG: 3'-5' exonuclease [Lachnospiraceae bacterium]